MRHHPTRVRASIAALFCLLLSHQAASSSLDAFYADALGLQNEGPALVAAAELDGMRGGFALPGGIVVGFGFDITTAVNGLPIQRFTLATDGTLAVSGAPGAPPATGGGQPLPVLAQTILNDGATRILTALDLGSAATIIANSADGQQITRRAVFSIEVDGLGAQLAQRSRDAALLDAATTRRVFGR